ncbi:MULTISPECIES: response regulator transcription factor [unclassified Paenibacillus]|uniref:response regulator transcription factor n=1 Tax=unclassified Paenibacillus TaxID=185978 RepID=UPI00211B222D|nr:MULTISPECIES: response regulator transcription factor [unclassified Paenibacillus]MDH6373110.1 two-component system response regulator ResD [Paenibacillus sp. PastF-3]
MSVFIRKNHKKILIIDDEAPMRELLQLYLHAEGYSTESAAGGKEALSRITVADFDLVILDLMMPIMDGFDVCKAIRQISTVPIIMLTAREETVDKVVGLKIGADDYLTKPFEHQELIARMESIFRRQEFVQQQNHMIVKPVQSISTLPAKSELTFRDLKMNLKTHQVFYQDMEIALTPKEYSILKLFLSHKERIFQREDILELLWKTRSINDDRTVDTHIKNLREKLSQAGIPGHDVIKTIWGTGYICNEKN